MAEFWIRPGEYRPDTQFDAVMARNRIHKGDPDVPYQRYEGPHGPLEVFAVDDLKATVVKGPSHDPVRLGWGPHSKNDRHWVDKLRSGIACRVGQVEVTFSHPRFGPTRAARAVHVQAGERRYVSRLRGYKSYVVERPDGFRIATFASLGRRPGWLHDGADQLEVVVVVLLHGSGLRLETPLSLP